MKKHILLFILMFFTMASVQFSACSSDEDEAADVVASLCTDTPTNTPTNDYMVVAQAFGGMQGCGVVMISKDGENVVDAEVKMGNSTFTYDEYMGYTGMIAATDGAEMELEVTHNGTLIASGKTCIPSSPTITNIDSGDVHQKNTALEVQWSSVENATAIEVTMTDPMGDEDHNSGFLDPTATTYTIPASWFDITSSWGGYAECEITVTAVNGISMENEDALGSDSLAIGVNIEGASGVFIAANADETTVVVPLDD